MAEIETVEGVRGLLVKMGLAQPVSRAFVAGTLAAGLVYLSGYPKEAFREDGSIKPLKYLSPEPDATHAHFLLVPVATAVAVGLFT